MAFSMSSISMRPWGPLPRTWAKSMPCSLAKRRAAGTTGTLPSPGDAGGAADWAVASTLARIALSTSASSIRPWGPLPATKPRSMLLSPANRRAAGTTCRGAPGAADALARGADTRSADIACGSVPATSGGAASPGSAMTQSNPRIGTISPSCAAMRCKTPDTVDSSSVCILAVSISTKGSPSWTLSPTCLSQRMMTPSCISIPHWGRTTSEAITLAP